PASRAGAELDLARPAGRRSACRSAGAQPVQNLERRKRQGELNLHRPDDIFAATRFLALRFTNVEMSPQRFMMMNCLFYFTVGLPLFPAMVIAAASAGAPINMIGFTAAHAAKQQTLEKQFNARLDPADQRAWLERMSAEPNHVGSPHNQANAEFVLEKFREWGWDARIETFYVLYPTPQKQTLEMVAPTSFTARLHEPPVEGDRTSSKTKDALPPYHAYGADGDVTGDLVYVNQGMPDDYEELDRHGISVKARIVSARYGGGGRVLK